MTAATKIATRPERVEAAYDRDVCTWTQEQGARLEGSTETRLPLKRFPETCPYTLDDVLTRPFAIDTDETP